MSQKTAPPVSDGRDYIEKLKLPCLSLLTTTAVMAEWLRRWSWNPMGSSRAGSNPARSETFCNTATRYLKQKRRNGKYYRSLQTTWTNQQEQKDTERQAGTVLWINLRTRSLIGCRRVDLFPARSDIFRWGIQKWHREQLSQMTVESVLDLEDDLEVKVLTIIDSHSCDGQVVKALDLKSNGVFTGQVRILLAANIFVTQ